ncbi:helix-turn-helix transcriptional regulator [Streptomyces griseosporeus]|uniref:helix-turn-helix transcriptional regulator n=1 Tax=Streptomyces griseosporeus TaxID=1910 RepID=UPI0036FE93DA
MAGEVVPAELQPCVAELAELGFVTFDEDHGNRPVALNPREVAQRNLDLLLAEATARVAQMRALRPAADLLAEHFERAQWQAGREAEYIDDQAVVNARLQDVVGSAQFEILSAQPGGPRQRVNVEGAIERDTAALDRGVVLRTLYLATVRDHLLTGEYARMMSQRPEGRSAEYRTLAEPFERAIIVDRKTAFVSNYLVEGAPAHSAWVFTNRAVVAYVVAEFEAKWRRAQPWHGEGRGRAVAAEVDARGVRTTRRQREVMREMADGRDQRAIASRLGISVRTVSDEITALKDLFDARSREQLMYKWCFSPDRLVDDSAPEATEGTAGAVEGGAAA